MTMKKIIPVFLALFLLAGCKIDADIRPNTIVDIPLDPTEEVTEPTTEPVTEEPTNVPTSLPTERATEKPKDSSGKTASKKPSTKKPANTKKDQSIKETEAAKATEPPAEAPTEPSTEAPSRPSATSYSPTKLDKAIISAINAQRAQEGLPELSISKKLSAAAAQRAFELSQSWSHTRPDCTDFSTVLAEFGIEADHCGENLHNCAGSPDAHALVDRWMTRDSNRNLILSTDFCTIGAASSTCDGVTYIAVLLIG